MSWIYARQPDISLRAENEIKLRCKIKKKKTNMKSENDRHRLSQFPTYDRNESSISVILKIYGISIFESIELPVSCNAKRIIFLLRNMMRHVIHKAQRFTCNFYKRSPTYVCFALHMQGASKSGTETEENRSVGNDTSEGARSCRSYWSRHVNFVEPYIVMYGMHFVSLNLTSYMCASMQWTREGLTVHAQLKMTALWRGERKYSIPHA